LEHSPVEDVIAHQEREALAPDVRPRDECGDTVLLVPSLVAVEPQCDAWWRCRCGCAFDGVSLIPDDHVDQADSGLCRGEDGAADQRHSGHRGQKL